MPRLEQLWKKYRDRGLSVVAVEATGDRARAQRFIRDNGLSFHFLENGSGADEVAERRFSVQYYPTLFLIDGAGKMIFRKTGFSPGDERNLEARITALLEK